MHTQTLECRSCGAALEVDVSAKTARCLYCASPNVVERPPAPDRPAPTFALGFVVTPERALETARRWVKKPWLAPSAFRGARVSEIRGLYVPAYLYSAEAHSRFSADIGENYTVRKTRMKDGKMVTESKTETEWRPLSGVYGTYVHDRVVTASRGLPNAELEAIEPFDLRALHPFDPKLISGWPAEEASMPMAECATLARQEAMGYVGSALSGFMPGDRHRNLTHHTQLQREHLALTMLPVWVLPVRYAPDKPVVRLLVNGQTGRLHGTPPRSTLKVVLLVLAVLLPFVMCCLASALATALGGS